MTLQIALSQVQALPYDFEAAVQEHVKARTAHAQTIGEPAPVAPDIVAAAVRRILPDETSNEERFVADYVIVKDIAFTEARGAAPPTLDQRKATLATAVQQLAAEAHERNIPALRMRFVSADMNRIGRVAEKDRSDEDAKKLGEYLTLMRRADVINLHHGRLEAAIHDLTAETISGWTPEPFPI